MNGNPQSDKRESRENYDIGMDAARSEQKRRPGMTGLAAAHGEEVGHYGPQHIASIYQNDDGRYHVHLKHDEYGEWESSHATKHEAVLHACDLARRISGRNATQWRQALRERTLKKGMTVSIRDLIKALKPQYTQERENADSAMAHSPTRPSGPGRPRKHVWSVASGGIWKTSGPSHSARVSGSSSEGYHGRVTVKGESKKSGSYGSPDLAKKWSEAHINHHYRFGSFPPGD